MYNPFNRYATCQMVVTQPLRKQLYAKDVRKWTVGRSWPDGCFSLQRTWIGKCAENRK